MTTSIPKAACLAAALTLAVPFVSSGTMPLVPGGDIAFAAGNGQGKGNSGKSESKGNSGKSDSAKVSKVSAKTSKGNSGNSGKSSNAGGKSSFGDFLTGIFGGEESGKTVKTKTQTQTKKKTATVATTEEAPAPAPAPAPVKAKNLNAQLGGLNSLKRNVNGLMNSSDPRMDGIRDYVVASADLDSSQAALDEAALKLDGAQTALQTLIDGYTFSAYDGDPDAYADTSLDGLRTRLDTLNTLLVDDPDNADLAAEIETLATAIGEIEGSEEAAALAAAADEAGTLETEVAELEALTGDEALIAALEQGANPNRLAEAGEDGYVTEDMLDWAKRVLGVGDYVGTIDDYAAMQTAPDEAAPAEPVEVAEAPAPEDAPL